MIYTGWAFISIGTARFFVAVDEGVCDRNWILTHLAVYNAVYVPALQREQASHPESIYKQGGW